MIERNKRPSSSKAFVASELFFKEILRFLSVSLVTVPVALAAMLIGPAGALICATIFGATSFFNAVSGASGLLSTLFQISPIGVFVTAVIARMLCGLCTGYIFKGLHKLSAKPAAYYLTGLAAPLLNTFFFPFHLS